MAAVMSVSNFLGCLEPFDKQKHDAESYLERFEHLCVVNLIIQPAFPAPPGDDPTPAQLAAHEAALIQFQNQLLVYEARKKGLFLTVIGDTAYTALQKKCLPQTPGQKSLVQIMEVFRTLFCPQVLDTAAQLLFDSRKQKDGESIEDFVLEIQRLAKDCAFGAYYDTALKVKLCGGVKSARIRWELRKSEPANFAAALALAKRLEPMDEQESEPRVNKLVFESSGNKQQSTQFRGRGRSPRWRGDNSNRRAGFNQPNPPPQNQQSQAPSSSRGRQPSRHTTSGRGNRRSYSQFRWQLPPGQCWRCGQWHDPNTCPVIEWSCNACGKNGHRERMCTQVKYAREGPENQEATGEDQSFEDYSEELEDIVVSLDETRLNRVYCNEYSSKSVSVGLQEKEQDLDELLIERNFKFSSNYLYHNVDVDDVYVDVSVNVDDGGVNDVHVKTNYVPVDVHNNCNDLVQTIREEKVKHVSVIGPVLTNVMVDNNISLKMEIDTGSKYSLLSAQMMKELMPKKKLKECDVKLWAVSDTPIPVIGKIEVTVHRKCLTLLIVNVSGTFTPLLGRQWLDELLPSWREYLNVEEQVNTVKNINGKTVEEILLQVKTDFPACFSSDRSQAIKGIKAEIVLKPGSKDLIHKDYVIPFNLRDQTIKELLEMERSGQIERVMYPKRASPVWPIMKPDGSVRLVVDFSKTINPQLMIDHYPLPKADELFVFLGGGNIFIVLDLTDAYKQLEVTESSMDILTVNTILGFFRYRRLIYGLASAAALFQCAMDVILKGIKNVKTYIDDVIIKAQDMNEALEILYKVLTQLSKHNVRVNFAKCQFFKKQVQYLGHLIDSDGIHPMPSKVTAIAQAPAPSNVTELRSYLGMVRYYSKFVPNFSTKLSVLHELLCDRVPWKWTKECQEAFELSKQEIAKYTMLTHYDPSKQLVLITDASQKGISAILAHRIDNQDKPIFCVSYSLKECQKNYSQLHREALAVVTGLTKFHKFLYGTKFILVTDNEALATILNPAKGLPIHAHERLVRYGVLLAAHRYTVERRPSQDMGPADTLSRLPANQEAIEIVNLLKSDDVIPINAEVIAMESKEDPILAPIYEYVMLGWPSKSTTDVQLNPYLQAKDLISVEKGCLMMGNRVIIPKSCQGEVLKLLHRGHPGMLRSKMLARSVMWWPLMDQAIEDVCRNCQACDVTNFKPTNHSVPWNKVGEPWYRIHIDFFHLKKDTFLILIDSTSKWIEISPPMSSTTADKVINQLSTYFATFGDPCELVCDNGPPFGSTEFAMFCSNRDIYLVHSPPYSPSSNGSAERAVRTVKCGLKKLLLENPQKPVIPLIQNFLQDYRNTPSTTTNMCPAQFLLCVKPKTVLTKVNPLCRDLSHSKIPTYNEGERVKYRSRKGDEVKFGTIAKVLGKTTYMVKINDELHLCSVNQLNRTVCETNLDVSNHERTEVIDPQPYVNIDKNIPRLEVYTPPKTNVNHRIPEIHSETTMSIPNNEPSPIPLQDAQKSGPSKEIVNPEIRRSGRTTKPPLFLTQNYVCE